MKNKKNATSPQKERCHNWKAAWKWVKVLYLTIMFHIYALILLSSPQTHTFSPTLTPHIKTCQNDWCVDGCCHLITVQGLLIFVPVWSIFFILLCGLGTNLGVLTPFMIWQSSLSSLSFWFMSPPFYIVDVLRLLSSGEGGSWTASTLRSPPVCWPPVWPGVPGLLCTWTPGQPDHTHTANQMWVEKPKIYR